MEGKQPSLPVSALEAYLRQLADTTADVIWVLDLDTGYFRYVSPSIERLRGITVAQSLGQRLEEVLTPTSMAYLSGLLPARIAEFRSGQLRVYRDELEQPHRDGSTVWVEAVSCPLLNPENGHLEVCGISRDISERRRLEQSLREREVQYLAAIDTSTDGFWVTDLEGRILEVNEAYVRRSGYSAAELLSLRISDLETEQTAQQAAARYELIVRQGREVYQTRHRAKDGTLWPVEVNAAYWPITGGRIFGFLHDLQRRQRSEALLRTRLQLAELAQQDNLNDLMTAALDAAETLTGSQISFFHFVDEDQENLTLQAWSTNTLKNMCQAEGKGMHYPVSQAGVWVDCVHTRAPVIHNDYASLAHKKGLPAGHAPVRRELVVPILQRGLVVAILGVGNKPTDYLQEDVQAVNELASLVIDLVQRRQTEEALRKSEEQLRQSQKLEAIGQLAGGVAHDFNNLLTVIISSAELLSMRLPTDDPRSRFAAEILDAGERAAALTRQLLAFSRKQVLAPEVLDLNNAVSDIAKMLRRLIGENILLTTLLSPDICRIRVDPGQLEQVILNLAVNARDAMPGGGRLIIETSDVQLDESYCRSRPDSRPGRYALLSLIDTGMGMSAEVKARIFEPFFTTKGSGQGTGLGLATVFGIIKQSEGHIEVDSEVGAGTTFRIYLPAVADQVAAPVPAAGQSDSRGNETVLLVEDEEPVRKLARLALETSGYRVVAAANGREALELAAGAGLRVDLLLTDVVMPELGGPELAARLQERRPDLRVLFMSGYIGDTLLRHGFTASSDSFLQKPFSPNSLVRKVRELLDGRRSGAA